MRDPSTYRNARRNKQRRKVAQKLKAFRKFHNMTRCECDFTRHLHPASYAVLMMVFNSATEVAA